MIGIYRAELMKLVRRPGTLVVAAVLVVYVLVLEYLVVYLIFKYPPSSLKLSGITAADFVRSLYPSEFHRTALSAINGLGGALALIVGVLALGGEYGWGTMKTLFTQGPGRLACFAGRILALAVVTAALTLVVFASAGGGALAVGLLEGHASQWPRADEVLRALAAGFLVMGLWATLGTMLAAFFRHSALAIGIGLVYSILLEGLLLTLVRQLSPFDVIAKALPGSNATALVQSFGSAILQQTGQLKPLVGVPQATEVLLAYLVLCLVVTGAVLRRRDVL